MGRPKKPLTADDLRHGTDAGYSSGCRCKPCRGAHREVTKAWRARKMQEGMPPDDPKHGTTTGYNYGCRCEPCREASRAWFARKRQEGLPSDDPKHGTWTGYVYGCRCARCRAAQAQQSRERAQVALDPSDPRHGSRNGYVNLGCRCPRCSEAAYEWRASKRGALAPDDPRHGTRGGYTLYGCKCLHCLTAQREYETTPRGRALGKARGQRRRAQAQNLDCGCATAENLIAVWELDGGLCAYCGAEGTDYEHVVPLSRGGWGCVSNFRVACKTCNSKKGTKPLSVFLARLAASGVPTRPGAANSGLPCPAAAERMSRRMLTASPTSLDRSAIA